MSAPDGLEERLDAVARTCGLGGGRICVTCVAALVRAEIAAQAETIRGFEAREKKWNESALMGSNLMWAEEAKKANATVTAQAATIAALREALREWHDPVNCAIPDCRACHLLAGRPPG